MSDEVQELRLRIEELDEKLVALFAQRFRLAAELGRRKAEAGMAIEDLPREEELHAIHQRQAREEGVSEEMTREIFTTVLRYSKELQARTGGDPL